MKRTNTTTRITLGLVLGLALWNAEPNLQAGTKTVTNTSDSGAGSLRQTIADAKSGDTINFRLKDCNLCTITLTSGPLLINKNLTIQGLGAQQLAVSGGGSRVLEIPSGVTVTLEGLTIRDGVGILGGGIINLGTLTVSNSTVSNNLGLNEAGGIINNGTLTIINSTVSNNSANSGGAIINLGTLAVRDSTVSNNSATDGGGIVNGGTLTVTNSTVSNNSASNGCGGIYSSGTLTVTNSTVSYNSASSLSGGLVFFGTPATINNTIVAGNVVGGLPNDIFGLLTSGSSHNLIGNAATSGGLVNGENGNIVGVDVSTVLEDLASNGGPTQTHKLLPDSPAVNAGDNDLAKDADNNTLQYDQRGPGFPRISGGNVDIGAFELGQAYNFSGFFPPVANPLTLNLAKAGSAIPVRFSLGGYQGLDIFMPGYPASQPTGCLDMPSDPVEETVTAGASSLSYDPGTDQYTYFWKTDRAWKDCRKLVIKLNDGSTHEAYFQFK